MAFMSYLTCGSFGQYAETISKCSGLQFMRRTGTVKIVVLSSVPPPLGEHGKFPLVMSSWSFDDTVRVGDDAVITQRLCCNLGVWSSKDVGVYQSKSTSNKICVMGNVGSRIFAACPVLL